jgi:hypothetical protein
VAGLIGHERRGDIYGRGDALGDGSEQVADIAGEYGGPDGWRLNAQRGRQRLPEDVGFDLVPELATGFAVGW